MAAKNSHLGYRYFLPEEIPEKDASTPPHLHEPPSKPSCSTQPTEQEMQALWFEHFFLRSLKLDNGGKIQVIQPGNWNHGPGPDFLQAAIRFENGTIAVGPVELHLEPKDWENHGHHEDPAYDETILHVAWEPGRQTFFPATSQYRRIPQLFLAQQLVAPWVELRSHLHHLRQTALPVAQRGRCSHHLTHFSPQALLEVIRDAGRVRLRRKAKRLAWRAATSSKEQALWEALAEALGYSYNKIPFRLLTQRLPYSTLTRLSSLHRAALLFGIAGLLPSGNLSRLSPSAQQWAQPLWEIWWKKRKDYTYAILTPSQWKTSGLRPWNRPERRLAALPYYLTRLSSLLQAVDQINPKLFQKLISDIQDPFWENHSTLKAKPLSKPHAIVGKQRADDMLINIFWPLVAHHDFPTAEKGLRHTLMASNSLSTVAHQRILHQLDLCPHQNEALIQQGLLQIYQDYCLIDSSHCHHCTFPQMLEAQNLSDA